MKVRNKRIAIILALFLVFSCAPEMCQTAEASTVHYTITIKIKQKKKKVKLDTTNLSLNIDEIYYLELKNAKANGVKWKSSNKKVATVRKDGTYGYIVAKSSGKATITATYKGKAYKCKVKVKGAMKNPISCNSGKTVNIYMDTLGSYSEGYLRFWSSVENITLYYEIEDDSIISCEWSDWEDDEVDLTIHPKKMGTTRLTITNSYNDQTLEFIVNVGEYDDL